MIGSRRICVVTGSRAEYGYLLPILRALRADIRFEVQLVVTGMHLSPEFGSTVSDIEMDGQAIAEKLETLISGDTPIAIAKSIGLGVIGFADMLERLRPDWLLILGDRYEIFAAAQAAMVAAIPIAHVAGGDTTEGVFDEAIRHSISKMAQLHFVTNEQSARRLRQMGEEPASVHVVGSPGLDLMREMPLLEKKALEDSLGTRLRERNLLVTYHPVTLDLEGSVRELKALLRALEGFCPDMGLFFTRSNADPGNQQLRETLHDWVRSRPNAATFTSLGQQRYLSLMKHVDAVVGNSSSGLYEAPYLHTPTVDVGDRQRGRLAADSVIRCDGETGAITKAIEAALKLDTSSVINPYGDGHAAPRILKVLAAVADPRQLLKKQFHMIGER